MENKTTKGNQLPEKKIRASPISATIWKNFQGRDEGAFFNITLDRVYKNKEGVWQTTNSLRVNDLPKAMVVLQKAYEYLVLKERESDSSVAVGHTMVGYEEIY